MRYSRFSNEPWFLAAKCVNANSASNDVIMYSVLGGSRRQL